MIKTKLPVVILRNLVLLPHGEIKLEISNEPDKIIISNSIKEHDSYVILISPFCLSDEELSLDDLPHMGIIGKITSNFELPNNHIRITITGVNRTNIYEYVKNSDIDLSAIIGPANIINENMNEEEASLRILKKEFASYISLMPNISNNIIIKINEENSLDRLTDIICNMLPLNYENKNKFIYELSPIKRSKLLLELINNEKSISQIERNLEKEVQENLDKSQRDFILREKLNIIKKELGEDFSKDEEINSLKESVSKLNCADNIKEKLYKEINKYEMLPPTSPEISIVKNYIDTMLSLPFGIYTKDIKNITKIEKALDNTHFGLEKVKSRILEYISVKELTKSIKSPIICLVGPPGVGKTSLALSIANALNREFVKISVGGVNDEAEIIGHRRTYLGSEPGRIINGMIKAKVSNPVFLIDEIDKMTKDIKGDPASALLEVLDQSQNNMFYDNYIEEAFDLSKVMFILTANTLEDIPYALRDRLEIINLSTYTVFEKLDIAKNYMMSKLLKEHGLTKSNLTIDDDMIKYIISNYTKEAGVRDLERVLSSIMRKVAKEIVETNKRVKVVITKENIENYLGKKKYDLDSEITNSKGVVNGLAYTMYGGSILPIESAYYKGKGNIIMTGSLGDVMKESASVAIGYVKSNHKEFNIDIKKLEENDIHINAINGAIPKDGPSAGVTLVTSIISTFLNKKVDKTIGMTGEITLNGNILAIGGLKEKTIAAFNSGIKTIFLPKGNKYDENEIPKEVKNNINIIYVDNYIEIFNYLFK
ncbi:MAG: endopeptidase La [Bacilli bacterium]|nr:endopeptidase La [Bacilli bacterium]